MIRGRAPVGKNALNDGISHNATCDLLPLSGKLIRGDLDACLR